MYVFCVDADRRPLDPCTEKTAERLLSTGKARLLRRFPNAIMLHRACQDATTVPCQLKVYPGAQATGLAIVRQDRVIWAGEITHRSKVIKARMDTRRSLRRARRSRKTRHRPARFQFRAKPKGWLPPSLQSRVENVRTWTRRLRALCPLTDISLAVTKFDTQKLQNPEISGEEYQQGTLYGYEVRSYVMEKFGYQCAVCRPARHDPDAKVLAVSPERRTLQIAHAVLRSQGGTDRVSNLYLSCRSCVENRGNRTLEQWLKSKPEVLARLKSQIKRPLRQEAHVNATRWAMLAALQEFGLPVEATTSATAHYHRWRLQLPKLPWAHAACVGAHTPEVLTVARGSMLGIKAMGHGKRSRSALVIPGMKKFNALRVLKEKGKVPPPEPLHPQGAKTGRRPANPVWKEIPQKDGTVKRVLRRKWDTPFYQVLVTCPKKVDGVQSGDLVEALTKSRGTVTGRVTIRAGGDFYIQQDDGKRVSFRSKNVRRVLHHADGYAYSHAPLFPPAETQEAPAEIAT